MRAQEIIRGIEPSEGSKTIELARFGLQAAGSSVNLPAQSVLPMWRMSGLLNLPKSQACRIAQVLRAVKRPPFEPIMWPEIAQRRQKVTDSCAFPAKNWANLLSSRKRARSDVSGGWLTEKRTKSRISCEATTCRLSENWIFASGQFMA